MATSPTDPCRMSFAARLAWVGVLAAAVTVPLVWSTSTFDVFTLTKLTLLWLLGLLVLAAWLLGRGWRWGPCRLAVVAVVHLAVVGLATAISPAPAVSLLGMYGRYGGLLTLVPVVGLSLVAAQLGAERSAQPTGPEQERARQSSGSDRPSQSAQAGGPDRLERPCQLALAIAVSAGLGGAYLVLQALGLDWVEWGASQHPPGALGNSNFSGAHAVMGVPVVAGLLAARPFPRRAADDQRRAGATLAWAGVLGLGGLGAAGAVVAQSQGAWLAGVAGLATTIAFVARQWLRPLVLGAAAVAAVLVVLAVGSIGRIGEELQSVDPIRERIDLWEVALRGLGDHPILGGGPDLFLVTFARHIDEVPDLEGVVADEPHNIALDVLDGAGILGLLSWLAVLVVVMRAWRRSAAGDGGPAPVSAAFAGLGVAYLVQGMASIDVVGLQLFGWLAAAGLLATTAAPTPSRTTLQRVHAVNPVVVVARVATSAAIVAMLVAGAWLAVQPLLADREYRDAIVASNRDAPSQVVLGHFAEAVELNPYEPVFRLRYATQLRREAAGAPPAQAMEWRRLAREQVARAEDILPDAARLLPG